jgi:hypothetical protein
MGKTQVWKIALLPAMALTPVVAVSSAVADTLEKPPIESQALLRSTQPTDPLVEALLRQYPTCQVAQRAIAQNPAAVEEGRLLGRVYSVLGDTVSLELENGETRHVTLPRWERGYMGNILGKKVVVTDFYCSRIAPAPPPPPVIKPIDLPKFEFTPITPAVPPLTPRQAPEQQPAPEIIPQTW